MQLIFEQIRAGGDRNFGYLLGDRDTRQGVLIDPSCSPEVFVHLSLDRCPDLTAFIALKRDWPTVKQRLGLK